MGLIFWNKLPETMGTHFGMGGKADGFSSKIFSVIGLPLILLGIHLVGALVMANDPKKQNISDKFYKLVLWFVPLISIIISIFIYSYNLNLKLDVTLFQTLILGFLFVIIGNYLPKARQNYTWGIKLPWTLDNEENWNRTHRLASIIWIIVGIILILGTFVTFLNNEYVIIGAVLTAIMVPSIYSFFLHIKKGL